MQIDPNPTHLNTSEFFFFFSKPRIYIGLGFVGRIQIGFGSGQTTTQDMKQSINDKKK